MKTKKSLIMKKIENYCLELPSETTRYATRIELINCNKYRRLDLWTDEVALSYFRKLEKEIKPSTIKTKARRLFGYFKWEISKGHRRCNPIHLKVLPKDVNENGPQALTQNEVEKLFKQVPRFTWLGLRDRLAISLMLTLGYRISTVININWEDVEKRGEDFILHTTGKGGKRISRRVRKDVGKLILEYAKFNLRDGESI